MLNENIIRAKAVLKGQFDSTEDIYRIALSLIRESAFGYARRLFAKLRNSQAAEYELRISLGRDDVKLILAQQHAFCTYKDPDLPADTKLDLALKILSEVEDLNETKNQETLRLAGDIYKDKWEGSGQRQHTERALAFYLRGYKEGPKTDSQYDYAITGINAAYLLDWLSYLDTQIAHTASSHSDYIDVRRKQAAEIRKRIADDLRNSSEKNKDKEEDWWVTVTIAEAYFGAKIYSKAKFWLEKAKELFEEGKVSDWKYQAAAKQLINLARFQAGASNAISLADVKRSESWRYIKEFLRLKGRDYSARNYLSLYGKVGLALSGGGFRAALFHIGVLAKLAELDVLRHIEVISCVSGGAIIGAHYYLEVRKLLQSKLDAEITQQDYIKIVERIERDFLAGVQCDIRTRAAAHIPTNLKIAFKRNYTGIERIGELFESEIFSRVSDGEGDKPRWLNELMIRPKGEETGFAPKSDNWRRAAKVPSLIINATTLNTGHNWQFTSSWMGEPTTGIDVESDGNPRLRRMYFSEAPEKYSKFRLGRAVAASASAPGLFDPITLDNLYPGLTVQLTDGGVNDNQGINGLLEQECTLILASDASGQLGSQEYPNSGIFDVPQRANAILAARVREAQQEMLSARRQASLLHGLMFVHLKKDLDVLPLDWIDCADPQENQDQLTLPNRRGALTSYGVHKKVQQCLAEIRTDLDAFSDTEAFALMTSGYLMTESEFHKQIEWDSQPKKERYFWRFLAVEESMKSVANSEMMRLLENAKHRISQAVQARQILKVLAVFVAGFVCPALFWLFKRRIIDAFPDDILSSTYRFFHGSLLGLGLTMAIIFLISPYILLLLSFLSSRSRSKTLTQIATGLVMSTFGWVPARIQLLIFDKWYLYNNKIQARTTPVKALPLPEVTSTIERLRDRLASNISEISLTQVIDRSTVVNAISRLYEVLGYQVVRFPRDREINPFMFDLDIYAHNGSYGICADVKTPLESIGSINWKDASNLKMAASFLSSQLLQKHKTDVTSSVNALLVLVDMKADDSLERFSKLEGVKILEITADDVHRIVTNTENLHELKKEANELLQLEKSEGVSISPKPTRHRKGR